MSSYKTISSFGPSNINSNPLGYCLVNKLESLFDNGTSSTNLSGPYNKNCQVFMSTVCANKWYDFCEKESNNTDTYYPNNIDTSCSPPTRSVGEILLYNTAARKYLTDVYGNCNLIQEPFDANVANSPIISYWSDPTKCMRIYEVDPLTIDKDEVMNKILEKPRIALDILVNIYYTARRKQTIDALKNTKLYELFQSQRFQNYLNSL
jgi:hypothetical protein